MKQLIDFLFERMLKISIFVYFSTHFFIYFNVSCSALTCIQDSKKKQKQEQEQIVDKDKKNKVEINRLRICR